MANLAENEEKTRCEFDPSTWFLPVGLEHFFEICSTEQHCEKLIHERGMVPDGWTASCIGVFTMGRTDGNFSTMAENRKRWNSTCYPFGTDNIPKSDNKGTIQTHIDANRIHLESWFKNHPQVVYFFALKGSLVRLFTAFPKLLTLFFTFE